MNAPTQNVNTDLRNPWICSPLYDLAFFSPIWWIPFCLACFFGLAPYIGLSVFFILYHILIRLPHFVATLPVTYFRRENWNHYRQQWIRYGLIPALILGMYFYFGTSTKDGFICKILATITIVWGLQHIAFQNYGILQIYHSRNDWFRPSLRIIENWIFALVVASAALVHGVVQIWWPNLLTQQALEIILFGQYALYAILGLVYVRESRRIKNPWPAVTFLLCSVLTMTYWPIYDRFPAISLSLFFYMFNGQHCLSYVGLTNYMLANRRDQLDQTSTALGFSKTLLYSAALIFASGVAVALYMWLNSDLLNSELLDTDRKYRLFGSFEGFFVAHYYLESVAWKFKDPHARENMFSLLGPRAAQPALDYSTEIERLSGNHSTAL